MSLIVPSEIKKGINPLSGFLDSSSKYGSKNLKGLFLLPVNIDYLARETYQMICSKTYVSDILSGMAKPPLAVSNLIEKFIPQRQQLKVVIPRMVEEWQLPNREDLSVRNPVQELHIVNFEFLRTTSKLIIQNPSLLISDVYNYDPQTGRNDMGEYTYGAASYSDGTWHPEHLFTESAANRKHTYWTPIDVTFDSNPPGGAFHARENHYSISNRRGGAGHGEFEKFESSPLDYTGPDGLDGSAWDELNSASVPNSIPNLTDLLDGPGPQAGNKYMYDHYGNKGFRRGGTFPVWQHTVQRRHYDRDNDEGLAEGGTSDRRTQRTRGYDMTALTTKSTF